MPGNEEGRIGERQEGAGEPGAGAAEQHRQHADPQHRIAERVRRGVVVADRAQHQAGTGAVEEQPDGDDERHREVNERILAEQDAADEWDVGQIRQVEMRRRHDLLADKAGADQAGKTDAENGQRQAGRHLVDRKAERQNAENPPPAPHRPGCRTSAPTKVEPDR